MNYLKHWSKFDHVTFLLIAPAIVFDLKYIALGFWGAALVYDLFEGYTGKE